MNITNWFKCNYDQKNSSMPKYFVMNSDMNPEWKSNLNVNQYTLFGNIKIKKDFNQILLLGISNELKPKININKELNDNLKIVPILKSNLQKCIRRSKVKKSVRTGKFLLDMYPNSLLRRLAIIYMEDVILDNYFNHIVWYMTAVSKGYILSEVDKLLILNIIKNLAKSPIKEDLEKIEFIDLEKYFLKIDQNILKNNYNLIWSLILRNKYGGMKGDIRMINGALKLYSQKRLQIKKIEIKNFNYDLKLRKKDILLESIDFHCTRILEILIKKKGFNYDEYYEICKKCIWHFRSGVTNKEIINKSSNSFIDNHELYDLIKDELDSISKNIISGRFNL